MYKHFYTLFGTTEITYREMDDKGNTIVMVETPDEDIGFKSFEYKIPLNMKVSSVGFDKNEIELLTYFIKTHTYEILSRAKELRLEMERSKNE